MTGEPDKERIATSLGDGLVALVEELSRTNCRIDELLTVAVKEIGNSVNVQLLAHTAWINKTMADTLTEVNAGLKVQAKWMEDRMRELMLDSERVSLNRRHVTAVEKLVDEMTRGDAP